nr:hypothetical protein [Tanacetum cinerariifolium]
MTVKMGKQISLDNTTVLRSFPPLSTPVSTMAGNAPGKSSYANITSKPSGKNSIDGLDAMLENGPWFIRNNPIILKKWHPNENLLKEDVSTVLVWVKLHGVPVTTFSKDGLSAIATKLGTPLMLDSYTSDMCMQSYCSSSYARVMVELQIDVELKDTIVVAMPKITYEGHYTCNVHVEYEGSLLGVCLRDSYPDNDDYDPYDDDMYKNYDFFEHLQSICDDLDIMRDSYPDNDDYDPYDDDMYKNHDFFEHLQSICDDLDITLNVIFRLNLFERRCFLLDIVMKEMVTYLRCLKGRSGNSRGKILAISMVEEVWLSEKKE